MEDLDFLKKWCLAHLKFDKEIFLKELLEISMNSVLKVIIT